VERSGTFAVLFRQVSITGSTFAFVRLVAGSICCAGTGFERGPCILAVRIGVVADNSGYECYLYRADLVIQAYSGCGKRTATEVALTTGRTEAEDA
jgi:hypothetical protein